MTAWLLTWMWQGLALAGGVAVALRCAHRLNAATKHFVWWGTLASLAWLGWSSAPGPAPADSNASAGVEPLFYVPSAPDLLLSIVIGIWAAIALVALLRLLSGLHAVYVLRDRCRPFPPHLEAALPLWLEAKARGRPAELMICPSVPGATVLGLQRPYIAVSPALLEALTIDELDQVILHEHAHVQRWDDWSQLAQTLLLTVLWIHPAALFITRALNREREMACDEWVVARTRLPKVYARCLARAAEVGNRVKSGPALAPAFGVRRHELVRRVDRLLSLRGSARRSVSLTAGMAAALTMAVSLAQLQGMRFAEIADIVLPQVARPMIAALKETKMAAPTSHAPVAFASTAPPLRRDIAPLAPVASFALVAPAARAPIAATAPAPITPTVPLALVELSTPFAGIYRLPDAPPAPAVAAPNPWTALATPGVEIASVAKKTGVGIANAFSRAGVSLARSF